MPTAKSKGKNLWGAIPQETSDDATRSPFAILEEQGEQLEKATQGRLQGRIVRSGQYGQEMVIDFFIYAEGLGQYSYPLLKVLHGVSMYPATLREHGEYDDITCNDDDEFEGALAKILSSQRVAQVVQGLLNQMPSSTTKSAKAKKPKKKP